MKYNYTSTPVSDTRGRLIKRPMVEIMIRNGKKSLKAFALIDSGADSTLMHKDYADFLGIDLTDAEKGSMLGIGNVSQKTYIVPTSFTAACANKPN